jgi:hypothetical protein
LCNLEKRPILALQPSIFRSQLRSFCVLILDAQGLADCGVSRLERKVATRCRLAMSENI